MAKVSKGQITKTACVHCGEPCDIDGITLDGKAFCCNGCKTVWQILHDNELGEYYTLDERPGVRPSDTGFDAKFAYLDDPSVVNRLLEFSSASTAKVTFSIPQMHCSSCIWLLENLYVLNHAVSRSIVEFQRRRITVTYNPQELSLRQLVELLASLGYEPNIKLAELDKTGPDRSFRWLYARLALAGFVFGNVMLLSFPEYLGLDFTVEQYGIWFAYLNLALSLPVVFFSAWDFFSSAWRGLRRRFINIDLPISIGILMLFGRSTYEILVLAEAGYVDSLAALVFLLLVGRIYQKKTYQSLSFERDYRSFFPIAVIRRSKTGDSTVPIEKLEPGDRIMIRNSEIVPADAVLIEGNGHIDYSFVTGEAEPVLAVSGDKIFAGGRQVGSAIELEVIKQPSHSYLMQLWNQQDHGFSDKEQEAELVSLANRLARIFTPAILALALAAGLYWWLEDPSKAVNAATAVLVIACPCALALATPFTLGTAQRLMGRKKFFVRDDATVERLGHIDEIVFDKTGTLTQSGESSIEFVGDSLDDDTAGLIGALARQSTHPLSRRIASVTPDTDLTVHDYYEVTGSGTSGIVEGREVRLGSAGFVGAQIDRSRATESRVCIAVDGRPLGFYRVANVYRPGLDTAVAALGKSYRLTLISGDRDAEVANLREIFGGDAELKFEQLPHQKLEYVRSERLTGNRVLMVGDGLNDAGALAEATVGVAVTEDSAAFTPASDGILQAENLASLPQFMALARRSLTTIKIGFALSIAYNVIGLFFAVQGTLSPVIAAVLMPASSVTVVALSTLLTAWQAKRVGVM